MKYCVKCKSYKKKNWFQILFSSNFRTGECMHDKNISPINGMPNQCPDVLRIGDYGGKSCGELGHWFEPKE